MLDAQIALIVILAVSTGLLLLIFSRLRKLYGTLRPNGAVTRAYEQHQLDPDLIYYSSGSDAYPRALIGIDRHFILTSDLWKRRDFDPATFHETIRNMQSSALETLQTLHGFEIVDQRDRRIGTWFSLLDARTTVKMLKDNQVRVDPPPLPAASAGP
jgi:hypothetical protein